VNWIIFALLFAVERWRDARGGPRGLVLAVGAGLWGLSRASDEWLFFFHPAHTGAFATAASGLALFAVGMALGIWLLLRRPSFGRAASQVFFSHEVDRVGSAEQGQTSTLHAEAVERTGGSGARPRPA